MITILILALVSNSIWATPIPKIDGDFANQLFALDKKHDKRIEENVMEMVQKIQPHVAQMVNVHVKTILMVKSVINAKMDILAFPIANVTQYTKLS